MIVGHGKKDCFDLFYENDKVATFRRLDSFQVDFCHLNFIS